MASQEIATLLRDDTEPEDPDVQVPPAAQEISDSRRSPACEICGSVLLQSMIEGANGISFARPIAVDATNATRTCGFRPLPSAM
ncbi:MAG TPA: hypothetical protein VLF40_06540 [Candidatus Saccharimonadales bacterium]|nr:hypothetical protein [Candidatus Saccharimonadales bacterium]